MANEVVIDGKLMSIGSKSWRPEVYQINYGADLGPYDPGSDKTRIGQTFANRGPGSGNQAQGHSKSQTTVDMSRMGQNISPEGQAVHNAKRSDSFLHRNGMPECSNTEDVGDCRSQKKQSSVMKIASKVILIIILVAAYNAYLVYAIHFHLATGRPMDWCGGLGFLIIITLIVYCNLLYFHVVKRFMRWRRIRIRPSKKMKQILSTTACKWVLTLSVISAICIFLIIDTVDDRHRLISAGGIVVIITFGALFSKSRKDIIWRHVTWGLTLQFIFGLLILRWKPGQAFFKCLGTKVDTFLGFTDVGSSFVFGYLVNQQPFLPNLLRNGSVEQQVAESINLAHAVPSIVVFKALSTVYFFSFLVSMLFYWGALQWLVVKIGWLLQATIGTTACESLNAAANIFIGQATAPFLIKPYLADLTLSEIHAVMTGGFATIAGTVLAAYVSFGVSSAHLVSASVMSAPAALAFSKLFYPETEKSKTKADNIVIEAPKEANVLDAATQGASSAGILVVNITAIVVAFLAFMAFLNSVVAFLGDLVGISGLSFDVILGKVFIPLTFVMGIEWDDCEKISRLIGLKTILNEFIAYRELGVLIENGELSQRSIVIATYALCGFANPGSIGVQLATLSSMAPERKSDFAAVAFRAFVSGTMACFLTACIAGALYDKEFYIKI
eukprot:GFUD01001864.1.p1 GENE.GFUD01001864.1~~GFUD01001864.1.p1  ORF type:complete len:670 (-),score=45.20 GFUD01001864.1:110-2119(-)